MVSGNLRSTNTCLLSLSPVRDVGDIVLLTRSLWLYTRCHVFECKLQSIDRWAARVEKRKWGLRWIWDSATRDRVTFGVDHQCHDTQVQGSCLERGISPLIGTFFFVFQQSAASGLAWRSWRLQASMGSWYLAAYCDPWSMIQKPEASRKHSPEERETPVLVLSPNMSVADAIFQHPPTRFLLQHSRYVSVDRDLSWYTWPLTSLLQLHKDRPAVLIREKREPCKC